MTLEVQLSDQIAAVDTEIVRRRVMLKRWVVQGRITQARADAAIDDMRAVAKSLRELMRIKEALHEGQTELRMSQMPEQENA